MKQVQKLFTPVAAPHEEQNLTAHAHVICIQ